MYYVFSNHYVLYHVKDQNMFIRVIRPNSEINIGNFAHFRNFYYISPLTRFLFCIYSNPYYSAIETNTMLLFQNHHFVCLTFLIYVDQHIVLKR